MAWTPERSKDHALRGPKRFLEQFKRSPNLSAFLQALLNRVQELEDAAWEVITLRNIVDGEGVILDSIGKIVGRKREGLSDTDYRIAIRAQIRINRSVGKAEDIISVAKLSMPDGYAFSYEQAYPAAEVVEVYPMADFNVSVLWRSIKAAKAGGVRIFLVVSLETPENRTFTCADYDPLDPTYATPQYDATMGFADFDGTGGGELTMVLGS